MPAGYDPAKISPSIIGLDPSRVGDLAAILQLPREEVITRLCFRGPETLVEIGSHSVIVRPGTADIFTIDDAFGAGYHRSLWPLPEQALIIDLGANIGLTAIDYASSHPTADVVAVELDEDNARLAEINTRSLDRVVVMHAGVAVQSGTVHYGHADHNAYAIGTGAEHSATAITIDDLLSEHPGRQVDLLKMDIEGAERDVLRSGAGWAPMVRRILVETHPPYTREAAVADLVGLGFAGAIDERHPAAVSGIRSDLTI